MATKGKQEKKGQKDKTKPSPSIPTTTASSPKPVSSSVEIPTILGYVRNVTPTKISRKGSEYFTFQVQEKRRTIKAVCFSPTKHKFTVVKKEENDIPCKVTKFNTDPKDKDVVWVNYNTIIEDPSETDVDFSTSQTPALAAEAPFVSTVDVNEIKVYEGVSVRGMVMFGDNTKEQLPKANLTKLDGILVDEQGTIPITIWNEQISSVQDGKSYSFKNIRVRQYMGDKYLSTTKDTSIDILHGFKRPNTEIVDVATKQLRHDVVKCTHFKTTHIQNHYACLKCKRKVPFRQDTDKLKCDNCYSTSLIESMPKSVNVRATVVSPDTDDVEWYSFSSSALEALLHQYCKIKHLPEPSVDTADEEILNDSLLHSREMQLYVKNDIIHKVVF